MKPMTTVMWTHARSSRHRRRARLVVILMAMWVAGVVPAHAVTPNEVLADSALEARARQLSKELRCQVCQNQSIDDSNAPLAADLRRLVRERLVAGDSDLQLLSFMTERYGDYVLLRPPMKLSTYALWFGPAVIFMIGAGALAVHLRRRGPNADERPMPLAPEEERRLNDVLASGGPR